MMVQRTVMDRLLLIVVLGGLVTAAANGSRPMADAESVLKELNSSPVVEGRESSKSYKVLFDAYLDLSPPPVPVGRDFNQAVIHSGMSNWGDVSGWAESNPHMAEAILKCKERGIFGLPYGREGLSEQYISGKLVADVAVDGDLLESDYSYLDALDAIAAFATAEVYRRMEVGQVQEGLDLAVAHLFVLRQVCDREMLVEKRHSISMLTMALANLRDVFWKYREQISHDQFREIAVQEIPFLRPDRNALFMPEGDRVVAEALIESVFQGDMVDPQRFASTFAQVQSADAPLTVFGAAKRWSMIAGVHGSRKATMERLQLVYDDWWRRWRVQEYDPILDFPSEFERTNPVRYAAVVAATRDIADLFDIRKELIVAVNGTAVSAGLCAYSRYFGTFPADQIMIYAQFARRSSDVDPYHRDYGPMLYTMLEQRHAVDTSRGRLWIEAGNGVLFSRGQDLTGGRAREHTDDGVSGDIIVWPPIKALSREQGLMD